MRMRTVALVCGAVVIAVAMFVVTLRASYRSQPAESQPPQIGGQQAPAAVREIDFALRYDAHCAFSGDTLTVIRGCKVVGFTGPDAPDDERSGSRFLSSPARRYFDRWLVLELSDGRLAYIPPSALKYLETAKAP